MVVALLISLFLSSQSIASGNLLRCQFAQDSKMKIQLSTTIDMMGKVVIEGFLSGKSLSCSYQIQEFYYQPGAVIPNVEFTLKKNKCSGDAGVVGRLNKTSTLRIESGKKGYVCSEDLVVNFPLARDLAPFYDGKMVRYQNERFQKGIWP